MRPGTTRFTGGSFNDVLFGGPGGDTFAAGGGQDRVDYSDRTEPLTIDQDGVADDGAFLEGDNVQGDITLVYGGSGDDRHHRKRDREHPLRRARTTTG